MHYDNGPAKNSSKNSYYFSLGMSKALDNISMKIGHIYSEQLFKVNSRIKMWNDSSKIYTRMILYSKVNYEKDKNTFGFLGALDLTRRILQKNDFFYTYTHNNHHSFTLRSENKKFR